MASSSVDSARHRKLALIIGNGNYNRSENRLDHSIENVRVLSDSFKAIGFKVTAACDLKKHEMTTTIIDFSKTVGADDLVFFYFSGHGYQVKGKNYLIPVGDAQIERNRDVEDFAINFERILERLVERNPSYINVFILDCRGTYLLKSTATSNSTAENKGLHEIKPTDGAFIQFACAANETVRDNLFSKHLLKNIAQENVNIVDVFRHIGDDVYQESNKKQRPLSINGLRQHREVCLNQVIPPVQVWDELKQNEIKSILKKQEELRACYDNFPDIDEIINRETSDIKNAEAFTQSILSELPSGNATETNLIYHAIKNLAGNENQGCLFFDSNQGVNLHDASGNLADISFKDRPFVLKLHSNDDFVNQKDSKDAQYDLKVIKTLDRVIEQNQSHPVIDDILERLSKAHNIDKNNIVLKNVYMGSFNIVYTITDLASNVIKKLFGLSKKLKQQFKQFKAAKIHPLLYRPSFDISQFDVRGNKTFSDQQGTRQVGPPGQTKPYIQPVGYTRYGLKVLGKYSNDEWLHPFGHPGNWYRAFHGTGNAKPVDFGNPNTSFDTQDVCVDATSSIHKTGFRDARTTVHGPGVYCSPNPTFVENGYAGNVKLDTKLGKKNFKIMLQVAVNPNDGFKDPNPDIWVVQHPENIRTYGILIKEA